MHVDVFCYGTLRTDPSTSVSYNCTDEELAECGMLDIQVQFDPYAELIGRLGGWRLDERTIFGDRKFVPAVSNWATADFVIGDLYRVTLDGFRTLLRYESWPSLYDYEVLKVTGTIGRLTEIREAVVFTTSRADTFGDPIPGGDYFAAPSTLEVTCAE